MQASLAAAEAQQLQLEADLALSRESLRSISGLEVGPLLQLRDEIEISPLEFESRLLCAAGSERGTIEVLAGEYALKAATEGVSERRGAYMPQISLIAQRQDSNVGLKIYPLTEQITLT